MIERYTLVWSFRNRPDVLEKSIKTADLFFPKSVDFCLIDAASSEDTIRLVRLVASEIKERRVRICESSYRSSLSEAWNLGVLLTENRYIIFSSSDVEFLSSSLFDHLSKYRQNTNAEYVLVENHSVFLLDKKAIPKFGWFDEKFAAGAHFDVDYMIRASENNIRFGILNNNGYYSHSDPPEVSVKRSSEGIEDRLPMNTLDNEIYFKEKWETSWPGWKNHLNQVHKPHPPTHISQVRRKLKEVDPHPLYTEKYGR